jgi:exonuclease VII small subunit
LAREQAEDATLNLKDAMARYEDIGNPAYANACRSTLRRAEAVLAAITDLHNREIAVLDGAP